MLCWPWDSARASNNQSGTAGMPQCYAYMMQQARVAQCVGVLQASQAATQQLFPGTLELDNEGSIQGLLALLHHYPSPLQAWAI